MLLQERFPNIKTLRLRTDGAGNFRNSSFVLLMPRLSQWTGLNILEFSVSEAGGGKDLTDSLIMQQKQRIREGVKQTGGSARNATECVATVQKGEEQVGSRGSCATREMIFNRPLGGVIGAKKGALPGISTMYHYQYEFTEADVFVGMRVFYHEGIGCGIGLLVDSEIVLSTRYGKVRVFINNDLVNRDRLSTRPYQQRPFINKV